MLTFFALGVVGMIVAGLLRGPRAVPAVSRSEAVRRVLRHIARRPIAEVADADAAVVRGAAVAVDEPLVAPLSGRSCIGYHVLIRDSLLGETVVDHARCGRFTVVDSTAEVLVSAEGLELAATEAPPMHLSPPLPPAIAAWVPPSWRSHNLVLTEGVLVEGAQVAACGVMQMTIAAGGMYRDGRAQRVLIASPTFPLVASPDRDLEAPSPRPVRPEELRDQPAT
jgi:hypothetical protein